jgi:phage terminase large subunit-like protein
MATASPSSPPSPELRLERFEAFCAAIDLALEGFQREIVEAVFSGRRELLALLPRGNGKTTLFAALALFHLLTTEAPAAYIGAASRDQASLLFDIARGMVGRHPEIERRVTIRHREMRANGGTLKVLASDAPKVHGLSPTLALVDELHAHRDAELYLALRTAMLKRPGSQMVTISTAGVGAESPLGRLRARALALPHVEREQALTRAEGPSFAMLEWAVPDDADLDDMTVVKAANPASWITEEGLREQREAVHPLAFARYHANQWTSVEHHWLPPGAWSSCARDYTIEAGEAVWLGVDVGGSRAASAVVWATEDLRVGSVIFQGDEAVLEVLEKVRELAGYYDARAVYFDPWRFQQGALELQREGLLTVEFAQSNARMVPASERLYGAVVEERLQQPNDPELNAQVAAAVAKDTPRGWRLEKSARSSQIDAVVALAMAVEAAEKRPAPTELVGWL